MTTKTIIQYIQKELEYHEKMIDDLNYSKDYKIGFIQALKTILEGIDKIEK